MSTKINSNKIINDPVYGFISFPYDIHYEIIEHPYFQRLRRIKQLGLTSYVYPGANHTRFQHALGAGHLMCQAIQILKSKSINITDHEEKAAISAILLHDIGHGPFSHSLEHSIIPDINHEELSLLFMKHLNKEFNGRLETAIKIFQNKYPKKFLHQLVSGQLDMDRLDYLKRDSYFTGVTEGVVGSDRIIKMLNVVNDELVVDNKGIYSIEKFLIARRLMYWQVYLHKTVLSAENLLLNILKRARELSLRGETLFASPAFNYFLQNKTSKSLFKNGDESEILYLFSQLDDDDINISAKNWIHHDDKILSRLCYWLINRKLYGIILQNNPFSEHELKEASRKVSKFFNVEKQDLNYYIPHGDISNLAYSVQDEKIKILQKNGKLIDVSAASDIFNLKTLSKTVKKYYLCYPKEFKKEGNIF